MLSLGIALMIQPKILLLDEPSLGLSPLMTQKVLNKVKEIVGVFNSSILMVEQSVKSAVDFSNRICILKAGMVADFDTVSKLQARNAIFEHLIPS